MTLEEMISLNRIGEKLAQMGCAPPGKEAYELAAHLLEVVKENRAMVLSRYGKQFENDQLAGNVCHLMRVHAAKPVVAAARDAVARLDAGENVSTAPLTHAVHNYNLIHAMPEAKLPEGEEPTP